VRALGLPALADDSGLCVDALEGAPGLISAHYGGVHGDAQRNIKRLLRELDAVPAGARTAHFLSTIVLLRHARDPAPVIVEGRWDGEILRAPRGSGGFGYDPVFHDPVLGMSAAELILAQEPRQPPRARASCIAANACRRRLSPDASPTPLALYVHIPWCVKKCPYCDFNSHGLKGRLPETEYVAALLADLDADLAEFADGLEAGTIDTVFFGGGTPSLFAPAAIGAVLDGVAARLRLAPDAEITLETNPGTVEHGRFRDYRAAGVNRISLGVQSFDDAALVRIGRIHGAEEARRAVRLAQDDGIDNINLD
jgi:non-canonical purine NTP pyrophosphatase (RdgB/HAM1 family)